MNRKNITISVCVVAILVIAFSSFIKQSDKKTNLNATTKSDELIQDFTYIETKKTSTKRKPLALIDNSGADEDRYRTELIKAQISQVSELYAETIKYPITSQPIRRAEDVRDHQPFEESEIDLPFPDGDEENPVRVIAATDKFQYFNGEVVTVRVQLMNVEESSHTQINGQIASNLGDLPIQIDFRPQNESLTEFIGQFDTNLVPQSNLSEEMLVKLAINVNDRVLKTTVAFKYAIASAQVIGTSQVQPQGANLKIPVQINVFQSGYYFLSAILQDLNTGIPLIQLQTEGRLTIGNGVLDLNAHITALKQQGSEGPYLLRSISLRRGAEQGELFDKPGSSINPQFTLPGFSFSNYDDEPYSDEESEERLEFLENIGNIE